MQERIKVIDNCYSYTQAELTLVDTKKASVNFNGQSWSDDDLSEVKSNIKQFYILEQIYTCPYCNQEIRSRNGRLWDIEHIIARDSEINFMFEPLNLCVTCPDCNLRKGKKKVTNSQARVRLPSNSESYLIIHPHFDTYEEHIEVIKAGAFYIAKTPKGEKTIEICGLNRFYEFVGYDETVSTDNRILQLATSLSTCSTDEERRYIRREIAALSIESNLRD